MNTTGLAVVSLMKSSGSDLSPSMQSMADGASDVLRHVTAVVCRTVADADDSHVTDACSRLAGPQWGDNQSEET